MNFLSKGLILSYHSRYNQGISQRSWTSNKNQAIQSSDESLVCQSNVLNTALLQPANKNTHGFTH